MELIAKQGFKQTEVGMIPLDWKIDFLNSIVDKRRTIRYGIVQPGKYDPNGKYLIRGQDYSFGWSSPDSFFRVSPQIEEPYKNARVKEGDIIITIVGASTGHVEVIPKWLDASNLTQTTARIAVDPSKGYSLFFKHYLISKFGQAQVANYIKGAAQPGLNCGDIEKFLVILPPTLTEQKAIATALSDVDDLIANLDKLITKKKVIKQGALQQLLTPPNKGGKRLAGFTGEWVETILGNVCEIRKGQLITESTRIDGPIPVIAGGKKAAYYHANANRLGKTITISGSGANAGYVPFHNYPIFASDCSTIEESAKYSIEYIFFLLSSMQKQIYNAQTGGAQPHIHPSDLNPIEVDVPNIEEQKAIAQILSDMDLEIEQLQTKKAKYQDIKQGMMQELLTGKTRLV